VLQGIELKQDDVLDEEERANIKVFQDNTPSVVNVTNLKAVQVLTACILFEILFFQSYHALSIIVMASCYVTLKTGSVSSSQQMTFKYADCFTTTPQGNRYSMNYENVPAGLGSGFIWDRNGHVVTNYHGTACAALSADRRDKI
jgi:S1-C subfamily serine protease